MSCWCTTPDGIYIKISGDEGCVDEHKISADIIGRMVFDQRVPGAVKTACSEIVHGIKAISRAVGSNIRISGGGGLKRSWCSGALSKVYMNDRITEAAIAKLGTHKAG
jgi:hypothetical protein